MQKRTTDFLQSLDWDDLRYFLAVARTQRATVAAKRLSVNYTTVARRIRALEESLGVLLFEKSRSDGFVLTDEGQRLLPHADALESMVQSAREQFVEKSTSLAGHVRIASTEAFGCYFLAPQLTRFQKIHEELLIDLLPLPHFVSLSKREADIAISLERPGRGAFVAAKLCDYKLRLYATRKYLSQNPRIRSKSDLSRHSFVSYVDNLAFSEELRYLHRVIPNVEARFCSTSVIAQGMAVRQNLSIGILPCFMAAQHEDLVAVLPNEVEITRSFWISCREDLRRLKRITTLWNFLRETVEANNSLLMGRDAQMSPMDA